jgi:hypothetical protein
MELKPWHLLLDGSFATLQPKFTHRSLAKPATLQVYSIACPWEKCLVYGSQVLGTMKDSELDGNVHCMQKNKIINRAKENKLAIIFAVSTKKEQ